MDSLLIGVPLGLLPLDAGRVLAQRGQLRLFVEETLGALYGLLASRDGGDEGTLRLRHDVELLRVLGLDRGMQGLALRSILREESLSLYKANVSELGRAGIH